MGANRYVKLLNSLKTATVTWSRWLPIVVGHTLQGGRRKIRVLIPPNDTVGKNSYHVAGCPGWTTSSMPIVDHLRLRPFAVSPNLAGLRVMTASRFGAAILVGNTFLSCVLLMKRRD
jgi:hypothetical protein